MDVIARKDQPGVESARAPDPLLVTDRGAVRIEPTVVNEAVDPTFRS